MGVGIRGAGWDGRYVGSAACVGGHWVSGCRKSVRSWNDGIVKGRKILKMTRRL